ncbi:MAG: hypothetical protein A2Y38_11655 [Spirochaetes bacterium GWB1_59_5]|nr:MAG: hypothetical protein A2Y38_11655 [Spirochaetes bacterium GWB1_59_5]
MRIALVGCGFLGSLLAEEITKRLGAFELGVEWLLFDDDEVDSRNPFNHLYSTSHIGMPKVVALAEYLDRYAGGILDEIAACREERVVAGSAEQLVLLRECSLIIDAVDNLSARQLLWELAVTHNLTLLHVGVSQAGIGCVEWTAPGYDSFSMSPIQLARYSEEELAGMTMLEKLKPCDLIAFRGVGLNIALAGAKAVALWRGMDAEKTLDLPGMFYTSWQADNLSHMLREVRASNG